MDTNTHENRMKIIKNIEEGILSEKELLIDMEIDLEILLSKRNLGIFGIESQDIETTYIEKRHLMNFNENDTTTRIDELLLQNNRIRYEIEIKEKTINYLLKDND